MVTPIIWRMTGVKQPIGTRLCHPPLNQPPPLATDYPLLLRRPGRVQTGRRHRTCVIQMISELLWKPLAIDFPGTKHSARNTSSGKSSEPGSIPARTLNRHKGFVPATTRKSGPDRSTFGVQRLTESRVILSPPEGLTKLLVRSLGGFRY